MTSLACSATSLSTQPPETEPCSLPDSMWANHQRVHQYIGGHNESYGGVTINIDTNAVDAPGSP